MAPKAQFKRIDGVLYQNGVAVASQKSKSELKLDDSWSTGAHLNKSKHKKGPKVVKKKRAAATVPAEIVTKKKAKTESVVNARSSTKKKAESKASVASKRKATKNSRRQIVEEEEEEEVASSSGGTDVEGNTASAMDRVDEDVVTEDGDTKCDSSDDEEESEDEEEVIEVDGGDDDGAVESELLDARIDRRLDTKLADGVGTHIQNKYVKSVRDPIVKKVGRVINKKLDKNVTKKIGDSVVEAIGDKVEERIGKDAKVQWEQAAGHAEGNHESLLWITKDLDGLRGDLTRFANWTNTALNYVKRSLDAINEGLGNDIDFSDLGSITDASGSNGTAKDDV